jgi:hypothetical protein
LTGERWKHIVTRHPELGSHRNHVLETVKDPDFIAKGLHGELKAVKLLIDLPMGARYLIVIYREVTPEDGFIITKCKEYSPALARGLSRSCKLHSELSV